MQESPEHHKPHKKYALFIGRWQPFHKGHKFIIDKALKKGKNVAIAVRETEISEKNPFTVEERMEMINKVYGDQVRVFSIPDIESINIGRKVGYDVNRIDVPEEVKEISGTEVREKIKSKNHRAETIQEIPDEVGEYLSQIAKTYWLIGLPCSGKTTLGKHLKEFLKNKKRQIIHLDGNVLRDGINEDLGFTPEERTENLRRVAHLAKLLNDKRHTVICSFITPRRKMREMIRKIVPGVQFIHLQCSVEECKKRDVKGEYAKAERGVIKDFTGVSAPFEKPFNPAAVVNTEKYSPEECLSTLVEQLELSNT